MIKIPKKLAFALFVLMTILLAISFSNFNWQIFDTNEGVKSIYKEIREPLLFLILVVYFLNYYIQKLKKEE